MTFFYIRHAAKLGRYSEIFGLLRSLERVPNCNEAFVEHWNITVDATTVRSAPISVHALPSTRNWTSDPKMVPDQNLVKWNNNWPNFLELLIIDIDFSMVALFLIYFDFFRFFLPYIKGPSKMSGIIIIRNHGKITAKSWENHFFTPEKGHLKPFKSSPADLISSTPAHLQVPWNDPKGKGTCRMKNIKEPDQQKIQRYWVGHLPSSLNHINLISLSQPLFLKEFHNMSKELLKICEKVQTGGETMQFLGLCWEVNRQITWKITNIQIHKLMSTLNKWSSEGNWWISPAPFFAAFLQPELSTKFCSPKCWVQELWKLNQDQSTVLYHAVAMGMICHDAGTSEENWLKSSCFGSFGRVWNHSSMAHVSRTWPYFNIEWCLMMS